MKTHPLLTCFLAIFLSATALRATIVFSDSFTDTSNWTKSSTGTFTAESTKDTDNFFQDGKDNPYLKLAFVSDTYAHNFGITLSGTGAGTTGQISFDFYDPQAGGGGNGVLLRLGTAHANGSTAFGIALRRGSLLAANGGSVGLSDSITTYSYKTLHTLTIVFNNTAASITYGNASYTLDGSSIDVWLDGNRVGAGIASVSGNSSLTGKNITAINFSDKSGYTGTLYIDNFEVRNDITIGSTIPEPSVSAAILASASIMALLAMHRLCRAK